MVQYTVHASKFVLHICLYVSGGILILIQVSTSALPFLPQFAGCLFKKAPTAPRYPSCLRKKACLAPLLQNLMAKDNV